MTNQTIINLIGDEVRRVSDIKGVHVRKIARMSSYDEPRTTKWIRSRICDAVKEQQKQWERNEVLKKVKVTSTYLPSSMVVAENDKGMVICANSLKQFGEITGGAVYRNLI